MHNRNHGAGSPGSEAIPCPFAVLSTSHLECPFFQPLKTNGSGKMPCGTALYIMLCISPVHYTSGRHSSWTPQGRSALGVELR